MACPLRGALVARDRCNLRYAFDYPATRVASGEARNVEAPSLATGGRIVAWGIAAMTVALLAVSAFGMKLGIPTFLVGAATAIVVLARKREPPWATLKGLSWGVLPLVSGLFVLVEAVETTGLLRILAESLQQAAIYSVRETAWATGLIVALASNLMNNLPIGLLTSSVVNAAHVPQAISSAILIGVDLGPNLSVTGSLATILWQRVVSKRVNSFKADSNDPTLIDAVKQAA
jgi:arsenical pump membrane protein